MLYNFFYVIVSFLLLSCCSRFIQGFHVTVRRKGDSSNYLITTSADATTPGAILSEKFKGVSKALYVIGGVVVASSIINPKISLARANRNWEKMALPVKDTLFDITFDPASPSHGWIVGTKGTFLETTDSGRSWITKTFADLGDEQDVKYRFEVASLSENEGWIVGKPAILLHSRDGGKQFERLPLPPKLPGDPISIKATGLDKAEMITSQGAIYTTSNGGLNWKALVKETIDATLNKISSSGTNGASFFTGSISNQVSTSHSMLMQYFFVG